MINVITPDLINASFQLLAAAFILNNCRATWKSKQAYGTSILSTIFFTSWGIWNAWYYPHLGQTISFYAGIAAVLANLFWIFSIWYIRKFNK